MRSVKKENGCYEVYAMKDGKKQQLVMNPVTGDLQPATVGLYGFVGADLSALSKDSFSFTRIPGKLSPP